jgi:hypothetical protein
MLTRVGDKFRLSVFEGFEIDESLPKHRKAKQKYVVNDSSSVGQMSEFRRNTFSTGISWANDRATIATNITSGNVEAPSLFERIMAHFGFIRGSRIEEKKPAPEPKSVKAADFVFDCIVKNDEQIKDIGAKIDKFKMMIEQAHVLGQRALEEELTAKWQVYCYEAQLVANGLVRVISEDRVIDFVSECERGLRLDWIKNFTRMIPGDLAKKKLEIDGLEIFDNYVIMHYDPDNKHNHWTKEQIEKELAKKRDPILFGVIDGSRKLYYIGDWKDEYCDLTWEVIADKIDAKDLRLE